MNKLTFLLNKEESVYKHKKDFLDTLKKEFALEKQKICKRPNFSSDLDVSIKNDYVFENYNREFVKHCDACKTSLEDIKPSYYFSPCKKCNNTGVIKIKVSVFIESYEHPYSKERRIYNANTSV